MVETQRTVLVVDDDAALRLTVAANLEEDGYVVLEAEDGQQALDLVRDQPAVELVVSDIRMPRLDGVQAYREIKRLRPELPVVMMTAFARERLILEAMVEGVFAVVIKPFDTAQLHQVLARALERPHVLVVDDDPQARASLVEGLGSCHLRALTAESCRAALDLLAKQEVDVAVIDMVMPEEDGLSCADQLTGADPRLGIVMMTGYDVPEMVRQASTRGVVTILRKPFDVKDLVRIIAERRSLAR